MSTKELIEIEVTQLSEEELLDAEAMDNVLGSLGHYIMLIENVF